jgi:hypothetical protein
MKVLPKHFFKLVTELPHYILIPAFLPLKRQLLGKAPCNFVEVDRCFRRAYRLYHWGDELLDHARDDVGSTHL